MGNFALSAAFELLRHSADWPLDRWPAGIALSFLTISSDFRITQMGRTQNVVSLIGNKLQLSDHSKNVQFNPVWSAF